VLYRRDLVQFDRGDAEVFDNYPGAPRGGQQRTVNLVDQGWIGPDAPWLRGAFVSAWADVNDDDAVNNNEKTPLPDSQFALVPFSPNHSACGPSFVCTWNPDTALSWQTNRNQDVTNAFFLASRYHDYLEQPPIGFTPDAGNFERADRDPVELNALDGAAVADGLPDGGHIDNANMATPPDGTPPRMQMFLWHTPGATEAEDPFLPVSGSNDTSILYHEYTHGLSNRLVVDSMGNSTLNSIQAGSMGEAWSDYYAEDFLVLNDFELDNANTDGQVRVAKYTTGDRFTFRNMAMDCDPDSRVAFCTDANGDHGYTYGDFATLPGGPEVHASGEIWAQTLWDLRERFGHDKADTLITRAMSLSPDDPSFLDMRNAILQADLVAFNGSDQPAIWQIFASRGMGYFAGSLGGGDTQPGEDFHVPPAPQTKKSTLFGQVTDPTSGDPVPNALVAITGHDSGFVGDLTAVTDDHGNYSIPDVFPGSYQKVAVLAPGFEVAVTPVTVQRGGQPTEQDFEIRRDWAASSGGSQIADFNGPDLSSFGCGPGGAIDLSQGTGWGSTTGDDQGTPTNQMIPKFITIHLPEPIDIAAGDAAPAFSVDPSNTCGDSGSASTNGYRIEVSTDGGVTFTTVAEAEFGVGNRAQFIDVSSNADVSGVTDVKFWMLSPQVPDFQTNCPNGNFSGCSFTDMTEIMVFGMPTS
jgi:extracellular elastinolytic metalloproteinase